MRKIMQLNFGTQCHLKLVLFCLILMQFRSFSYTQNPKHQERILHFAQTISFMQDDNFFYNRRSIFMPLRVQQPFIQFVQWTDSLEIEDIHSFIYQKDPKARALGLLALYQKERFESVYIFRQFLGDTARCFKKDPFPWYALIPNYNDQEIDLMIAKEKWLTVAEVAEQLVERYCRGSGYRLADSTRYFKNNPPGGPVPAGFWSLLRDRATGSSNYGRELMYPRFEKLMARMDTIKNPTDRTFIKLMTSVNPESGFNIYTESELLLEMQGFGKENIKAYLSQKLATQDLDLQKMMKKVNDSSIMRWIALHATAFFDTGDVDFLLEQTKTLEKDERPSIYWYIACARLDSIHAAEYLKMGLSIYTKEYDYFNRFDLFKELWRCCPTQEMNYILNWIFSSYRIKEQAKEKVDWFIYSLDQPKDLALIKKIIADPRFDKLILISNVVNLAKQINRITGIETVPEKYIEPIWYPMGIDLIEWQIKEARRKYPSKTYLAFRRTKLLKKQLKLYVSSS